LNAEHDLYLDLMMRCLTDWIYDGVDERARAEGRDWPARAHTMIGLKRLANLRMSMGVRPISKFFLAIPRRV
jgi:demethyldecarbamoylnovobiocin O-methyltransferase/8-demethyl-8-(2,3-dimethoxy-alpha-L-rhamnosyl)tetracenomycin-C 4'-O-methyltransferase